MILSSCGAKAVGVPRADIVMPIKPEVLPVEIFPCEKDFKCPSKTAVCLSVKNFQNLQENVLNYEIYIEQLENLLNSLKN